MAAKRKPTQDEIILQAIVKHHLESATTPGFITGRFKPSPGPLRGPTDMTVSAAADATKTKRKDRYPRRGGGE